MESDPKNYLQKIFFYISFFLIFLAFESKAQGFENEVVISVFPNPTYDYLTIDTGDIEEQKQVVIRDISGKLMYESYDFNTSEIIDLTTFCQGIYSVEIYLKNKKIVEKIVKI